MKIIIAGAGVAGLATGWRLAQAGAAVEIVERGLAGRGASWAAAGMLAPGVEAGTEESAFAHFARESRAAWKDFATELEEASGLDIAFRESGSLVLAADNVQAGALQSQAKEMRGNGMTVEWLTAEKARRREPLLSQALRGALLVPGDAHVDNRALSEALAAAFARAGGLLREACEMQSLFVAGGRVRGIVTSAGAIEGDAVILASGAWLNGAAGVVPDTLPRVAPVKGQMIALEPPTGTALPATLLWNDDTYLVPRRGRLLVGATVEEAGFDTSVTREAANRLHAAAARIFPATRDWSIAETWAGLRPRASDSMPVLGETGIGGLYVASGQFRNGILFAPMVAEVMRQIVLNEGANTYSAFDPKRFSAK